LRQSCALRLLNTSFKIGAELEIPAGGAEGVLVTQGGRFNGWGLYLLAGKPVFHYNTVGVYRSTVAGPDPLPPGTHTPSCSTSHMTGAWAKAASPH